VLLWPFVILALGRDLRRLGMVTAIAIVVVWALRFELVLSGTNQSYIYRAFETRLDNVLVGCLLAIVVRRRAWSGLFGWIAKNPLVAFGGSVLALATSGCLQSEIGHAYRDTIGFIVDPIALAFLVVLVATFADRAALRWTKCRSLCALGTISYGMYLYHPLAISAVLHFSPHRGPLQVVAAFVLSTIAGAVSYSVIERPFVTSPKRRVLRPVVLTTRPTSDAGVFRTSQFAV
jgi:peptidoglycan/LPS O-acetylase OafA/YrhL